MGLDGVELIMAVEEEFQFAITDEDACMISTPNDLTNLVYSKVNKAKKGTCPSQHDFYLVRKALIKHLGIERNEIKPSTRLEEIIEKKLRRKILNNILSSISDGQTVFFKLERPKFLKQCIFIMVLLAFTTSLVETNNELTLSLLFASFCAIVLIFITSIFQSEFPEDFKTVKDLVRITGSLESKTWNREEVYSRVKEIIVEQLSVNEEDVLPNSNFIDDLGMG